MTLTWRQIGLYAGLASLGFLAGLAAGAALVGGSLPTEIAVPLVSLVVLIIGGAAAVGRVVIDRVVAALQPELTSNTAITQQTHALVNGERAALTQRLTAVTLRMEAAERVVHMLEALPDCSPCRSRIAGLLAEWRTTYRDATPPAGTEVRA